MADIQSPQIIGNRKTGVNKAKRLSTKVDLTPMVDLGFLLITFFVFTTALTKPNALSLIIPAKGENTLTAESKTLNLVLAADNKVHYWVGNEVGNQGCTDFSTDGVRSVILFMQSRVREQFGSRNEMVVLIRPSKEASYANVIDILDEMLINDIKKYALMDEPDDQMMLPANVKQPC